MDFMYSKSCPLAEDHSLTLDYKFDGSTHQMLQSFITVAKPQLDRIGGFLRLKPGTMF